MANYISKERLEELKVQLDELKKIKRKEIANRIENAISLGDLSENAEYHEAREEQAFNEGKIQELEDVMRDAVLIKEKEHSKPKDIAEVGDVVDVKKNGESLAFTIVGSTEADPALKKISNESPLGKALLGRTVGEEVEVNTPAGKKTYKIIRIS